MCCTIIPPATIPEDRGQCDGMIQGLAGWSEHLGIIYCWSIAVGINLRYSVRQTVL